VSPSRVTLRDSSNYAPKKAPRGLKLEDQTDKRSRVKREIDHSPNPAKRAKNNSASDDEDDSSMDLEGSSSMMDLELELEASDSETLASAAARSKKKSPEMEEAVNHEAQETAEEAAARAKAAALAEKRTESIKQYSVLTAKHDMLSGIKAAEKKVLEDEEKEATANKRQELEKLFKGHGKDSEALVQRDLDAWVAERQRAAAKAKLPPAPAPDPAQPLKKKTAKKEEPVPQLKDDNSWWGMLINEEDRVVSEALLGLMRQLGPIVGEQELEAAQARVYAKAAQARAKTKTVTNTSDAEGLRALLVELEVDGLQEGVLSKCETMIEAHLSHLAKNDGNDECILLESKSDKVGSRALIDYPHARHNCLVFKWKQAMNTAHCPNCFCYVCEVPAKECKEWSTGANHSRAHDDAAGLWKKIQLEHKAKKAAAGDDFDSDSDSDSDDEQAVPCARYQRAATEEKEDGGELGAQDESVEKIFSAYEPDLEFGQDHPDKVVETTSLTYVDAPKITYELKMRSHAVLRSVVDNGNLSKLQLETIAACCQRHETKLKDSATAGYFIGDGAGVGKGRMLAGLIMENWLQGNKRALWVSVSSDLMQDAKRDLRDVGAIIDDLGVFDRFPVSTPLAPLVVRTSC